VDSKLLAAYLMSCGVIYFGASVEWNQSLGERLDQACYKALISLGSEREALVDVVGKNSSLRGSH